MTANYNTTRSLDSALTDRPDLELGATLLSPLPDLHEDRLEPAVDQREGAGLNERPEFVAEAPQSADTNGEAGPSAEEIRAKIDNCFNNNGLPPLNIDDEYWLSLGRPVMTPEAPTKRHPGEVPNYDTPLPSLDHIGYKRLKALDKAGRLAVEVGGETQPLRALIGPIQPESHTSRLQQFRDIAHTTRSAAQTRLHNTLQHLRSDANLIRGSITNWLTEQRDTYQQDGIQGLIRLAMQAAAERYSYAVVELKDFALDQVPAAAMLTGVIAVMWLEDVTISSIGRSFKARSPMPFLQSLTMPVAAVAESLVGEVMHDIRALLRYSAPPPLPDDSTNMFHTPKRAAQWAATDDLLETIGAGRARLTVNADLPKVIDAAPPAPSVILLGDGSRNTRPLPALGDYDSEHDDTIPDTDKPSEAQPETSRHEPPDPWAETAPLDGPRPTPEYAPRVLEAFEEQDQLTNHPLRDHSQELNGPTNPQTTTPGQSAPTHRAR